MAETELSRSIAKAIESLGYEVVRIQSGTRSGGRMRLAKAGTSDRLVMLHDMRVLWLEVKTAEGKERESQKKFRARAEKLGHVVRIVKSVGEAIEAVRAADRGDLVREGKAVSQ
jgi:hypothetical protein